MVKEKQPHSGWKQTAVLWSEHLLGFLEGVLPVLRPSVGWAGAALGGPPRTLPCLFWWAGRSLTARCSLSSAWPVNSPEGLQRRGAEQRVGRFVRSSKVKMAVEHVRICEETLWFSHAVSYSVFCFRWLCMFLVLFSCLLFRRRNFYSGLMIPAGSTVGTCDSINTHPISCLHQQPLACNMILLPSHTSHRRRCEWLESSALSTRYEVSCTCT